MKPKSLHNFKSIHEEFQKIALTLQRQNATNVAIAYNYGSSLSTVVDAASFTELCSAGVEHPFPTDVQVSGSEQSLSTYTLLFDLLGFIPEICTSVLCFSSIYLLCH